MIANRGVRRHGVWRVVAGLALLIGLAAPQQAWAKLYARVLADHAPVRTGPSAQHRVIYKAPRDQVMPVLRRASSDYWLLVELEDGTSGWVYGELVFPFDVSPTPPRGLLARTNAALERTILGPSTVNRASMSMAFSAGVLDREGIFMLRPQWLLHPMFAVAFSVGVSPRSDKTMYTAGVGPMLRLVPGAPITPFAAMELAAVHLRPKADNFVDPTETVMGLSAGGGLEITFKKQITARLDARRWNIFDQNRMAAAMELTGGLAIFF